MNWKCDGDDDCNKDSDVNDRSDEANCGKFETSVGRQWLLLEISLIWCVNNSGAPRSYFTVKHRFLTRFELPLATPLTPATWGSSYVGIQLNCWKLIWL